MYQIVNGPKLPCYKSAMKVARARLLRQPEWPPLVKFLGTKKPWPNSDAMNLDFYLRPPHPGKQDFSVDPTWAANPKPEGR